MRKSIYTVLLAFLCIICTGCSANIRGNSKDITPFLFPTNGAVIEETGKVSFYTEEENNTFNAVQLQLWSDIPKDHILNFVTSQEGKTSGIYTHKLKSGYYIISLKANSNKKDEAVDARVLLINGESYFYSFNILALEENAVHIDDYEFRYAFR